VRIRYSIATQIIAGAGIEGVRQHLGRKLTSPSGACLHIAGAGAIKRRDGGGRTASRHVCLIVEGKSKDHVQYKGLTSLDFW
jgi:hypothetical protein